MGFTDLQIFIVDVDEKRNSKNYCNQVFNKSIS